MKLGENGHIQIPPDIRQRRGWTPGTELEFSEVGSDVRIRRVLRDPVTGKTQQEMTPEERRGAMERWLSASVGILKGKVTTEEAMSLTRGED